MTGQLREEGFQEGLNLARVGPAPGRDDLHDGFTKIFEKERLADHVIDASQGLPPAAISISAYAVIITTGWAGFRSLMTAAS